MNIFTWIWLRLRPEPSVDKIMAGFHKTIQKLEAVSDLKEQEARSQKEAAEAAAEAEKNARIEAGRAKAVASNLSELAVA